MAAAPRSFRWLDQPDVPLAGPDDPEPSVEGLRERRRRIDDPHVVHVEAAVRHLASGFALRRVGPRGDRGSEGVYEVLPGDDHVRDLIAHRGQVVRGEGGEVLRERSPALALRLAGGVLAVDA